MVQTNNAFVRSEQAKMKKMMGNRPTVSREMEDFCAYMSNDGEHAKEFARDLTRGMDEAFPVK